MGKCAITLAITGGVIYIIKHSSPARGVKVGSDQRWGLACEPPQPGIHTLLNKRRRFLSATRRRCFHLAFFCSYNFFFLIFSIYCSYIRHLSPVSLLPFLILLAVFVLCCSSFQTMPPSCIVLISFSQPSLLLVLLRVPYHHYHLFMYLCFAFVILSAITLYYHPVLFFLFSSSVFFVFLSPFSSASLFLNFLACFS